MIVRRLADLAGMGRETTAPTWTSRRFLLKEDGMGFSLHDTIIRAGTETHMWYKHHVEAVYCLEGAGSIEDVHTGTLYTLAPGTMYALDGHEKHIVRAETDLRMICVFNPPCVGDEVHDEEGVYPADPKLVAT